MQSPQKPWKHGKHPEYTHLRVVLNLCQDEFGNVWSDHTFASSKDEALAAELSNGGHPQIAHALLSEALRREVFLLALVKMSSDPEFLRRWKDADEASRASIQEELEKALVEVVTKTAEKGASGVVAGVLTMLADQV